MANKVKKLTARRPLLPGLNFIISKAIALSADASKLELSDNFEASKRLRKGLIEIKNKDLPKYIKKIQRIRDNMRVKPEGETENKKIRSSTIGKKGVAANKK